MCPILRPLSSLLFSTRGSGSDGGGSNNLAKDRGWLYNSIIFEKNIFSFSINLTSRESLFEKCFEQKEQHTHILWRRLDMRHLPFANTLTMACGGGGGGALNRTPQLAHGLRSIINSFKIDFINRRVFAFYFLLISGLSFLFSLDLQCSLLCTHTAAGSKSMASNLSGQHSCWPHFGNPRMPDGALH